MSTLLATDRPTILVVDDEPLVRRTFRRCLNDAGFGVVEAGDATAAMIELRTTPVDLVVLDLTLPEVDGHALLTSIRRIARYDEVPVIIVSGDSSVERRIELLGAGADDFVAKPADIGELVARVRARLRAAGNPVDIDVDARRRIQDVIDDGRFRPVFQPIVELATRRVVAYEALSRFDDGVAPDKQFAEAERVGLGATLELATLRMAVSHAPLLPRHAELSLNVSVALLLDDRLDAELHPLGDRPVMLELTEHERVDDYDLVHRASRRFGENVRLSVDDAGSGYSSLSHVLALRPTFVKLDRAWIAGIDGDPARQALVLGIGRFVDELGGAVVAEGIETADELAAVEALGVHLGQGWHLGRPTPVDELLPPDAATGVTGLRASG